MTFFNLFKREIKPYAVGYLPECDGHRIYYQQVGNPAGEIVLSFHGGPGGSSRAKYADFFNLKKYRVILFDQRACGLSIFKDPFYKNTTQDTAADTVRLLNHLNVRGKIVALGVSFGSTCATLFAEMFPERVKKLVLVSVFLGRDKDSENTSASAALFYPDALDILQKQVGKRSLQDAYHHLIFSDKHTDQKKALQYYGAFEKQLGSLEVKFDAPELTEKALLRFRVMMHYVKNKMFLTENQLVKNARKIAGIPCVIYQNRLDFCCPPYQAYELHKALPKSKLVLFADSGHGSAELHERIRKDFR